MNGKLGFTLKEILILLKTTGVRPNVRGGCGA